MRHHKTSLFCTMENANFWFKGFFNASPKTEGCKQLGVRECDMLFLMAHYISQDSR